MINVMQKKFWQKRHNQLNEEIATNLQSMYTWAVQLNEACARRDQWRSDKKHITGDVSAVYPTGNEQVLAECVINFIMEGTVAVPTGVKPSTLKLRRKAKKLARASVQRTPVVDITKADANDLVSPDIKVDIEDNEDGTIDVAVGGKDMNPEDFKAFTEVGLNEHEVQQEILAEHMDDRRVKLLEEQSHDLSELNGEMIPELEDINPKPKVHFLLDVADDTVPRQGNLMGTEPVPVKNETEHLTEVIQKHARRSLDARENPTYKFCGKDKGPPEKQAQLAPTVSPLLSLSKNKREELYFNLFQQAKRNVSSMVREGDLSQEETDSQINKESDRLLANWMEANQMK